MKDLTKYQTHDLAERLGMTAAELRRRMSLPEMVDWMGYDRYKAALMSQARERAKMEADAERKATQGRGHQLRKR